MAATCATIEVVTSSPLFRQITAFIPGVPHFVLAFKALESRQNLESSSVDSNSTKTQIGTPLWQAAVLRKNKRVLRALGELSSIHVYKSSPHVLLGNLLGFALMHSSQSDDIAFLDWLYTTFPDNAAEQHTRRQISEEQFQELARKLDTSLVIAEWIRDHGYVFPASTMDAAASAGNLAFVRFLHEHGTEGCTTAAMDSAASHGHLAVVKFLHLRRQEGCTDAAKTRALQNGHVVVLRFLHENRKSDGYSSMAVLLGVMKGQLECVRFAHEHGFTGFEKSVLSYAVMWDQLDLVRFLHEHRPAEGCTLDSLLAAERRGHRDVVDFLCQSRPPTDPVAAIEEAVNHGQLRLAAKLLLNSAAAFWSATKRYEYPDVHSNACR